MNKTPISILHEFGMKDGALPAYTLISEKVVNHKNVFKVEVKYKNLSAVGEALTKKEAKQIAAQNMILLIKESQSNYATVPILQLKNNDNDDLKSELPKINTKLEEAVNYIGKLQEYCTLNKLVQPEYETTEIGTMPFLKFRVICTLGAIIEEGTSHTKKQAKQLAAKQILDRLFYSNALVIAEKNDKRENKRVQNNLKQENEDAITKLGIRLLKFNLHLSGEAVEEKYKEIKKRSVKSDITTRDPKRFQNYYLHVKTIIRNMVCNDRDEDLSTICDDIKRFKTSLSKITNTNCNNINTIDNILKYIRETLKLDIEQRIISCYNPLLKAVAYKIKAPIPITQFGANSNLQIANAMALHNILDTIMIYLK